MSYDAIKVLKDHKIRFEHDFGWNKQVLDALNVAIEALADVMPVRRGKWEVDEAGAGICSVCQKYAFETGEYHISGWFPNYCPHCGAKME